MLPVLAHCQREYYDIYIARPSKWGNPYSHLPSDKCVAEYQVASRKEAIEMYEKWIRQQPELMAAIPELIGKRLGCWCGAKACHGHVLIKLVKEHLDKEANESEGTERSVQGL